MEVQIGWLKLLAETFGPNGRIKSEHLWVCTKSMHLHILTLEIQKIFQFWVQMKTLEFASEIQ